MRSFLGLVRRRDAEADIAARVEAERRDRDRLHEGQRAEIARLRIQIDYYNSVVVDDGPYWCCGRNAVNDQTVIAPTVSAKKLGELIAERDELRQRVATFRRQGTLWTLGDKR
jgi:hypothetical protein